MKRMLAAALVFAGLTACGGAAAPKEFVVSVINPSTVAGANADCDSANTSDYIAVDLNTAYHVIVYQGDSTHYYAEVPDLAAGAGGVTLEGTLTSGTYNFTGQTQDETFAPDLSNKEIDDKKLLTISLMLKDSGSNNVTGNFTIEQKHTCDNLSGNTNFCKAAGLPDANGNTVDCITSGNLAGIELPGPEYKEGVGTPGSGGIPNNF